VAINWMEDLGAPAVVTAVNLAARASTATVFGNYPMADIASYGMTALGYASAFGLIFKGNQFVKNIGIAAAPLAMEKLYNMIRGTPMNRVGRRVTRYPAPASESPFQGVRLV
jgi:hypothetical protein